jgi:DNA-binding PadR family transcriptional regulator
MSRTRKPSQQTLAILSALAGADWLYGLELAERTGLKSGSLYPILIRLDERALVESRWVEASTPGRPPRHAYRILPAGRHALAEAERAARAPTRPRESLA